MKDGTKQYLDTVAWLGKLYNYVNETLFENELKRPVITVQTDESNKAYGWFTLRRVWKENADDEGEYEINMSAQFLNRPVNETVGTLIHEMCHQYALKHNIQDCSRSCTYHNKMFKQIAEKHGLKVEKLKIDKYGWAKTSITEETAELISFFLEKFPAELIYHAPVIKGVRLKNSSTRKYICPCCAMSVRATRSVNIMCADCNEYMTVEL